VSPAPPVASTGGAPNAISLSLSFQGDYTPVQAFIGKLLGPDRLVVIDSVGLTPQAGSSSMSSLTVTMTARVFTDAPSATPAAGSTAAGSTARATTSTGAKSG
jgi:hypothetical protein